MVTRRTILSDRGDENIKSERKERYKCSRAVAGPAGFDPPEGSGCQPGIEQLISIMITLTDGLMSSWNVGPEEKLLAFPCDKYPLDEDAVLYRGISILAPASFVYRWLCQLRVSPYSYDRLDNLGRQSPQTLTLGADRLEVGQRMMGFELVDFQPDQSITLRGKATIYGDGVGSYLILPLTDSSVRLLAKIRIKYPRGLKGLLVRLFLPLGDMIMMRRQLLNLKKLSEQTYHTNSE